MTDRRTLPVDDLHVDPCNPRPDPGDVDDLAASMARVGLLVPLLVRRNGDGWGVLAGSRRLAAAQRAGISRVPCLVVDPGDDDEALALATTDNVAREALDPVSEARAYRRLVDAGWTQTRAAERCGVSQQKVSVYLTVLDEADDVTLAEIMAGDESIWQVYDRIRHQRAKDDGRLGATRGSGMDTGAASSDGDPDPGHCGACPGRSVPAGHQYVALPIELVTTAKLRAGKAASPADRDRLIADTLREALQ